MDTPPPSYWKELWIITRALIIIIISVLILIFGVGWLADSGNHPTRFILIILAIQIIGMTIWFSWIIYKQKKKNWEYNQTEEMKWLHDKSKWNKSRN